MSATVIPLQASTPFSASQPLFLATPTLKAFVQPHVDHFVMAQLNFDHESEVSLASDPIPDSTLEVFKNHHNSEMGPTGTNTAFWAQDNYDFLANYGHKADIY
jgi:hypothetical protein